MLLFYLNITFIFTEALCCMKYNNEMFVWWNLSVLLFSAFENDGPALALSSTTSAKRQHALDLLLFFTPFCLFFHLFYYLLVKSRKKEWYGHWFDTIGVCGGWREAQFVGEVSRLGQRQLRVFKTKCCATLGYGPVSKHHTTNVTRNSG